MSVLAACHLIYASSVVCIISLYMLVANKVLSLSAFELIVCQVLL